METLWWVPSANVLVMGDLMTNGSYPVIDESSCGIQIVYLTL